MEATVPKKGSSKRAKPTGKRPPHRRKGTFAEANWGASTIDPMTGGCPIESGCLPRGSSPLNHDTQTEPNENVWNWHKADKVRAAKTSACCPNPELKTRCPWSNMDGRQSQFSVAGPCNQSSGRFPQLPSGTFLNKSSPGFEPTGPRRRLIRQNPLGRYLVPLGRSTFASTRPAKRDCAPM